MERMNISDITNDMIRDAVVVKPDENNGCYEGHGYLVAKCPDGEYVLGNYSHCSCYGTWGNGSPTLQWKGTWAELRAMAEGGLDPDMPSRKADITDSDYGHVGPLYRDILAIQQAP